MRGSRCSLLDSDYDDERESAVVDASFPLLTTDYGCDTEVTTPHRGADKEEEEEENEQVEQKQVYVSEDDNVLEPQLFAYPSDEEDLPRAPPNTPQPPLTETKEESDAMTTPPRTPVFGPIETDEPRTPTQAQVARRKPPKTEAIIKTRSRIELASPLMGAYRGPSAQSAVMPGCLTAPAKRTQSRITSARRIIAVADTNVLLRDLSLVENTQNYNVTLVIPYAVVRELDGLKNGDSLTARDARIALHTLRKWVKGGPYSSIRFQNIDEVPKSRSVRGRTRSNDDRILDCCLYYAEVSELEEGQKVILLTNDVALQVKAETFAAGKNAPRLVAAMGLRTFYEKEVWRLL